MNIRRWRYLRINAERLIRVCLYLERRSERSVPIPELPLADTRSTNERVLSVMGDRPVSVAEICQGGNDSTVRQSLKRLLLSKKIRKVSYGVYERTATMALLLTLLLGCRSDKAPSSKDVFTPISPPLPMSAQANVLRERVSAQSLSGVPLLTLTNVTLAWDASPDPSVTGYRLHWGTNSGVYTQSASVGNVLTSTVPNLELGLVHYFVATAYDDSGAESDFSNEIFYYAPAPPQLFRLQFRTYIFRADWEGPEGMLQFSHDLGTNKVWQDDRPMPAGSSILITNGMEPMIFYRVRVPFP